MTPEARNSSRRAARAIALVVALGVALAGCGRAQRIAAPAPGDPGASDFTFDPGQAGDASQRRGSLRTTRDFYPLAVGNRWDYVNTSTMRIVSPGSPDGIGESEYAYVAEIIGTEVFGERLYHLQAEYSVGELTDPLPLTVAPFALRQDQSGLYNRDLLFLAREARGRPAGAGSGEAAALRAQFTRALAGHPHRAAFERAVEAIAARIPRLRASAFGGRLDPGGGADPDEIALLRYPLHPFASWIVRDSPRFSRLVEARESLELPAGRFSAWRIRGDSEFYGPADVVHFWYAREGLVRMLLHTESDAVDEGGNIVGRVLWDLDQRLSTYSLEGTVGPGRTAATFGVPEDER